MNPREVCVAGGRYPIFPPLVLAQQLTAPVADVELRVDQNEVGLQVRMPIILTYPRV
jgi:hypothetical protein